MKKVLTTSRVIKKAIFDENHLTLDLRWLDFLSICGICPIILPPSLPHAKEIIKSMDYDGILLTGGGDISELGGLDKGRDQVEEHLIKLAASKNIPIIGVCRGMQKIQAYFGERSFDKIPDNISKKQKARFDVSGIKVMKGERSGDRTINSYHNFGVRKNSLKDFKTFAVSEKGVVKGIKHKNKNMIGIMWHPEREKPFKQIDIKLFKGFYE
jgi:gamma-glutamyl-gamma-aminobutyrate hydrolase PuuD